MPTDVRFRLVQTQIFCISTLAFCVSHFSDICTEAIKNIRNIHTASANQVADILYFNDNEILFLWKLIFIK